jgi:hypothetical protein
MTLMFLKRMDIYGLKIDNTIQHGSVVGPRFIDERELKGFINLGGKR